MSTNSVYTAFFDSYIESRRMQQIEAETATQSSTSSTSEELFEQTTRSLHEIATLSLGTKDLSGEPRLEEVLETVGCVRATKEGSTQAIAHLLEHFNKDWLFELYEATKNPHLLVILGQKIEIRYAFEQSLIELSKMVSSQQRPTCFVSFAIEDGVSRWLEKIFVPDLALIGVDPVFCFKDLESGMDLNAFQEKILETDKVVVICTPQSEQYCRDRRPPYGFAQEVVLAKKREKKDTVIPVWLKGDPKQFDPNILFGIDNTFGSILNEDGRVVWSYYAKAFELFACIRGGIGRDEARKIRERFFVAITKILEKQDFSIGELKLASLQQDAESKKRVPGITKGVTRKVTKMNLPPYPPYFTGRSRQLQSLNDLYKRGTQRVAITGPSGVGKSALALAFVHQCKARFEFIHVIQVFENATFQQGLLKLADEFNLRGTKEERLESLMDLIKEFNQKHLILVDNVDDIETYEGLKALMQHSPDCCFLVTSVMPEQPLRLGLEHFELFPFEHEEAETYLCQATPLGAIANGKKLAKDLHYYPCALAAAAEYIRTNGCNASYFRERYQSEGTKLLTLDHRHLTAWHRSLQKIQSKMGGNSRATQMLTFCSLFPQSLICREKLKGWADAHSFQLDFDRSLKWLFEFGLIASPSRGFFSISPLLRQEIIENLHLTAKRKNDLNGLEFEKHVFFGEQKPELENPKEYDDSPHTIGLPKRPITAAVQLLKKDKFIHLKVEGHRNTDVASRRLLSEKRAEFVKELIVQNDPSFENRIRATGIASLKPIDASKGPCYERNRVAVIQIDVEKTMEAENLLPLMNLEDILRAKSSYVASMQDPKVENLLSEAVKIKLYAMKFIQYVFFFGDRATLVDPSQYEGSMTNTGIERPITATINLLRKYPFLHISIEGHHHADNKANDKENQISIDRANYIKNLIVEKDPGSTFANRVTSIGVGGNKPLDTAAKPIQKRNRVAIIRIDIDKSTKACQSTDGYHFF